MASRGEVTSRGGELVYRCEGYARPFAAVNATKV